MALVFKLDETGGFVVGDTETRQTAYAHPGSPFAVLAGEEPDTIAARMQVLANVNDRVLGEDFSRRMNDRNWARLRDVDQRVVSVIGGRA